MKFSQFIEDSRLSFSSPISKEEWDRITDVEFERTEEVTFRTPGGKEVPFRKVKHGEWIKGKEIARRMLANKTLHIEYKNFTCSNCGIVLKDLLYHTDGSPFYNFCPNCGADMKEKGEAER